MNPLRTSLTVVATAVAAATLAPTAQADCCSTFGPVTGALALQDDHAVLAYASVDGAAVESGGMEQSHGALARFGADGVVTRTPLPGGDTASLGVPALSVRDGAASVAWTDSTTVKSATLDAAGVLGAPSLITAGPADLFAPALVAHQADGSRLLAWVQDHALHARRVSAAGAPLGADVIVATALPSAPAVRMSSDYSGAAVLLWEDAQGAHVQLIAAGADAVAATGTLLPAGDVLSASPDGAGGAYVVLATGPVTAQTTRLLALRPGVADPTATVLAKALKNMHASAVVTSTGVAFLAKGKGGKADVMVRVLMSGAPPRRALNVSYTSTAEAGVDAIALGVNERRVVLYRRAPKGSSQTESLLRSITTQSGRRGKEINVSKTKKDSESDGRLVVGVDGTAFVAYTTTHYVSTTDASYGCDTLRVRSVTGAVVSKATAIATCDVRSAI